MLIKIQSDYEDNILQIDTENLNNPHFVNVTVTDNEDLEAMQVMVNVYDLYGALTAFIESNAKNPLK